ncbi:MAG: gamma-glutamyltransferase, partial [Anaerolineales bacterium]|nr:gamma-glutamyltransferase [Anaerolineales bacterium]
MDITAIESKFRPTPDMKSSSAGEGMVATAFPDATRSGVEILQRGGNAVDAACAAAFAIGVCEPQASGIGGETNVILHVDGKTTVLDGSSRAPGLVDINSVSDESLSVGYTGTTVPSTVAVLGDLHRRFGLLKWNEILEPAINIAKEGYKITQFQHQLQVQELPLFKKVPALSGSRYYLKDGSKPFETGDLFTQADLVLILQDIADFGPEYFYTGKPAGIIDEDMRANGGFLRSDDLGRIPWPVERTPITTMYRGLKIATLPPSSGGRMLLHTLSSLDRCPPSLIAGQTPESYSLLAGIFKSALHLNEENIPHPDYYSSEHDFMLSGESAGINIKSMMEKYFPDASG